VGLGRCFRFVYYYAYIVVLRCYRFSVNEKLKINIWKKNSIKSDGYSPMTRFDTLLLHRFVVLHKTHNLLFTAKLWHFSSSVGKKAVSMPPLRQGA